MKCVIPCAGFGTRFSSVVPDTAKALVKINGKSILDNIFDKLELVSGIDEVFVVSNGFFLSDFQEWVDNYSGKKKLRLICDGALSNEKRTGRIHAIKLVLQFLSRRNDLDDLMIVYGDNLFDFDIKGFYDSFENDDKSLNVAFDVKNLDEAKKLGVYSVDSNDNAVELVEKPDNPPSTLCASGIYAVKKSDLKYFYEDYSKDDPVDPGVTHVFIRLIKDSRVRIFRSENNWVDIGTKETYERALREF